MRDLDEDYFNAGLHFGVKGRFRKFNLWKQPFIGNQILTIYIFNIVFIDFTLVRSVVSMYYLIKI